MKFSSAISGKVTMTMRLDDVGPAQGFLVPNMIGAVQGLFAMTPSGLTPMQGLQLRAQGAVPPPTLADGVLIEDGGRYAIKQAEFSPDGSVIAITASTTNDAMLAISRIHEVLEASLGFKDVSEHCKYHYFSSVVVEFESDLEEMVEPLAKMTSLIAAAMRAEGSIKSPVSLNRVAFAPSPAEIPVGLAHMNWHFLLERRVGNGSDEGRWYSEAPFETSQHLALLGEIERAITVSS